MENDVRRGVTNARFNEDNANLLYTEILLVSIYFGYSFSSWWIFGLLFIGLCIFIRVRVISLFFCLAMSVLWSGFGVVIGASFGSVSAKIVLGTIVFCISMGIHLSALQWVGDIGVIHAEDKGGNEKSRESLRPEEDDDLELSKSRINLN